MYFSMSGSFPPSSVQGFIPVVLYVVIDCSCPLLGIIHSMNIPQCMCPLPAEGQQRCSQLGTVRSKSLWTSSVDAVHPQRPARPLEPRDHVHFPKGTKMIPAFC